MKIFTIKLSSVSILVLVTLLWSLTLAERSRDTKPADRVIPPPGIEVSGLTENIVSLPYMEDFESGAPGWQFTGLAGIIDNPQNIMVLNPAIQPTLVILPTNPSYLPSANSGSKVVWFGHDTTGTFIGPDWHTLQQLPLNGGTSVAPQSGELYSPAIDLTGVSQAQMRFHCWWEIEGVDVDAYDMMFVEVMEDSSGTFIPLGRGNINPLNDVDGESWKPYSSAGLGMPGQWIECVFDLTPFVGHIVNIRIRFDTIDELYNGFRGLVLDDFQVNSDPFPMPTPTQIFPGSAFQGELVDIFGDNFVNGALITIDVPGPGEEVAVSAVLHRQLAEFIVPPLPTGNYNITLTNPDGQSDTLHNALNITTNPPPDVFSIMPDSSLYGSPTQVTISGVNFQPGIQVHIGGMEMPVDTLIMFSIIQGTPPVNLPVGIHNVVVTNPDGQFDQLVLAYTVFDPTGIQLSNETIPQKTNLVGNYPNPFNPSTRIRFNISQAGKTRLDVYNLVGQHILTLIDGELLPGAYEADFHAADLPSGIYFSLLRVNGRVYSQKMILMK